MRQQVVVLILDGWGVGPRNETNPVFLQGTPNIDYLKENFLVGALQASGISVGLPWNEEGNSEVGHLTIGAGKVLYQHYPRITLAIRDGSFAANKVFLDAFAHVKKNQSALNLAGLITEGNIHASLQHVIALVKLAGQHGVEKINLHLFTDGKDSEPKSFLKLYERLVAETIGGWAVGSISGRHYALDRDANWDRTEKAYRAMTGHAKNNSRNVEALIREAYQRVQNDQYIEPRTVDPDACVKDNDALIFTDFREDSIRQIAASFIQKDFSAFSVEKFENLYIATFTPYSDEFNVPVAFPPEHVSTPLAKVLANQGLTQLHVAETEKYAHITYFLNGYQEYTFPGEERILIPSDTTMSHDEKPEMQAAEITSRILTALHHRTHDFIVANFANADMIAHTGNFEAGMAAVKKIDESIGAITRTILKENAVLIITSDHGNIEIMRDKYTGAATTAHDPSPVPIYIAGNNFVKQKTKEEADEAEQAVVGLLSDVAPTILHIMEIPKPEEMTGENLLPILG